MKRYKIILVLLALIGLGLFAPIACEEKEEVLPTWLTADHRGKEAKLPVWLTLEHRQLKVEAEEVIEEVVEEVTGQGAVTSEQPKAAISAAPEAEAPLWQQAGTMEYIGKMKLDELVHRYKNSPDEEGRKRIIDLAAALGIDVKTEYGLDPQVEEEEDKFYEIGEFDKKVF